MLTVLRRPVLLVVLFAVVVAFSAASPTLRAADGLTETQRLAALAKVWGLLKYFHPDVARTTIDWDQTLVDTIPRVRAARSREDLNHELMTLAQTPGTSLPLTPSPGAQMPSDVFGWLDDENVIDPTVGAYLKLIAAGNQPVQRLRYVALDAEGVCAPDVFLADAGGYKGPTYPDEGHRLLALFRYWNIVQYFDVNRGLIDRDWGDVLEEFVPRMLQAADATEYHLALAELVANISDSHTFALSSVLQAYWGNYYLPFSTRLVEGQTVIDKVLPRLMGANLDLRVGDVITEIDGIPAATARASFRKYISASNAGFLEGAMNFHLLPSATNAPRSLVVTRDGGASASVSVVPARYADCAHDLNASDDHTPYRLLDGNIGYLNMRYVESADFKTAMQLFKNTRGIIVDVRQRPDISPYEPLPYIMVDTSAPIMKWLAPDPAHPGSSRWRLQRPWGPSYENPDYYKGQVVVLVNEETISLGEYWVLALRAGPATTVIGSRTAGACGVMYFIDLPGGFETAFTGDVFFYPDGRPIQRVGILPDIEVRPTIAGIREGRDELMEAAIAFINKPPAIPSIDKPTARGRNRDKRSGLPVDRRRVAPRRIER